MDFKQKFEIETGNSIYSGNGQMLPEGTYSDDFVEYLLNQLNIAVVVKSLPNIYEGTLNSERIKQIDDVKELYTINRTSVSDIFCRGANWYKQKITK